MSEEHEKNRIKPLIKKMGRGEIEELCPKKGWTIIDFESALKNIDEIPYDCFWVSEYDDDNGETRPCIAIKTENGLEKTTCNKNFMQYCVVLRPKKGIDSSISAIDRELEYLLSIKHDNSIDELKVSTAMLSIVKRISGWIKENSLENSE